MSDGSSGDTWVQMIGSGGVGAVIGVIGTIVVAVINQRSPMAALIDSRIRSVFEEKDKIIKHLQDEVERLEQKSDGLERKVDWLTRALDEATGRGFGH